jgi:hypothetical protein
MSRRRWLTPTWSAPPARSGTSTPPHGNDGNEPRGKAGDSLTPTRRRRPGTKYQALTGGKGSGLGLPQVLGVAKQLGGGVRIQMRPGRVQP